MHFEDMNQITKFSWNGKTKILFKVNGSRAVCELNVFMALRPARYTFSGIHLNHNACHQHQFRKQGFTNFLMRREKLKF